MNKDALPALVSLHDVMPETFDRVEQILLRLRKQGIPPITLLVVPGRDWEFAHLERLRLLADGGHELAAHGWFHHVPSITGWWHRLHSAFFSRHVAEHLALDADGILRLMRASRDWFADNALPEPTLYVPPAWALGSIPNEKLASSGFEQIETFGGLHSIRTKKRFHRLPLVGFEADTRFRAAAVAAWNAFQRRRARATRRPLRIAIHPHDFELRLSADLDQLLDEPFDFLRYGEIAALDADPPRQSKRSHCLGAGSGRP